MRKENDRQWDVGSDETRLYPEEIRAEATADLVLQSYNIDTGYMLGIRFSNPQARVGMKVRLAAERAASEFSGDTTRIFRISFSSRLETVGYEIIRAVEAAPPGKLMEIMSVGTRTLAVLDRLGIAYSIISADHQRS